MSSTIELVVVYRRQDACFTEPMADVECQDSSKSRRVVHLDRDNARLIHAVVDARLGYNSCFRIIITPDSSDILWYHPAPWRTCSEKEM